MIVKMTKLHVCLFVLVLLSLVEYAFPSCCPACSTASISKLRPDQIQQIEANRDFIKELEQNPELLYSNDEVQREVVKLTIRQERQILRNFPQIFVSRQAVAEAEETRGAIIIPEANTTNSPQRRRRATHEKVCEPVYASDPFILVHTPRGQVVQLAETASENQWILKETCGEMRDPCPDCNLACGLAERPVSALFINLSEILDNGFDTDHFDFAYVVVQCCVTIIP